MSLFIAIDIGSSFLKAAVFDIEQNSIVEQVKVKSPAKEILADGNKYEVKAALYVDLVKKFIDEFSSKYQNIKGLLLSTQQHGFVYEVDKDCRYISWQDQRCIEIKAKDESYLDYLHSIIPEPLLKPCGVPLKPALGMCNLFTMLEQDPALPRNGELYTLGSYIYKHIIGRNIAHPQNLTQLGIYQVHDKIYNRELLKLLGLEQVKLPEITDSDTQVVGVLHKNGQEIKVYPDFGDVQISALGAGLPYDGALINIATAAQVLVPTNEFSRGKFETRPYFNNSYIKVISNMPSGRNIDVFIRFISQVMLDVFGIKTEPGFIFEQVHRLLKDKKLSALEIDPRFYATGDHVSGGVISGINANNLNISMLFAALFKSMAKTYISTIKDLCDLYKLSAIVCAGGVSWRLPELIQEIEKEAHIPCRLSLMEDESLNGMLIAAKMCFEANRD